MEKTNIKVAEKKRILGFFEVGFDSIYLITAFSIGIFFLRQPSSKSQILAILIVFTLATGDSFHLIPRIMAVLRNNPAQFIVAMGWGKLISSISMTLFYILLWQFGYTLFNKIPSITENAIIYISAAIRIILCFFPQNKWVSEEQPIKWAVLRNIPFVVLGATVAAFYFSNRLLVSSLTYLWLVIVFSFAFYLPVVLFVGCNRKFGMLMLPKTCMYIAMLGMLIVSI